MDIISHTLYCNLINVEFLLDIHSAVINGVYNMKYLQQLDCVGTN